MEQKHLFSNKMLKSILIPVILEQLLNSFMGTADTMMVSNVGSAAISAVSLVDSINVLLIQAFSALAAGGTIICAQYMGQRNYKEANKSARQVLFIILAISAAVTFLCLLFKDPLLHFIFGKVDADVMENSSVYFLFSAVSYPFIALYDSGASIFRAQENTKGPLIISLISNVMNIGGNAILIWGFHMGVAGAAIATLVSRIFCAVVVLWQLRKDRQPIVVRDYLKIRPDGKLIGRILGLGIPSGVENSMFQLGKLAIQSTVSTLGTTAIAAQAMTNNLEMLNGTAAMGVGIGLMTIVGECLLCEEAVRCGRDDHYRILPSGICTYKAYHPSWRYGGRKCEDVFPDDGLDHSSKASCMGGILYSGLWYACCRGCEIFHDHFLCKHVGVQVLLMCISDPCYGYGTTGCMVGNVYRLDHPWDYFYLAVPQQEVAEA